MRNVSIWPGALFAAALTVAAAVATRLHGAPRAEDVSRAEKEFEAKQGEAVVRLGEAESLKGRFAQGARGKPVFETEAGVVLPLDNAAQFDAVPTGLNVELFATKVPEATKIKAEQWKTRVAAQWDREVKGKFPVNNFGKLHEAYVELDSVTSELNGPGEMNPIKADKLAKTYAKIEDATLDAYAKVNKHSPEAKLFCEQFANVRRDRKAIYRRYDNYRPEVYRKIYENSDSAVAIVHKFAGHGQPKGSGVVIGKNLVLTCNHCIEGKAAADLEVWFDFTRGNTFEPAAGAAYSVTKIVFNGVAPQAGMGELDFSLLEIEPVGAAPAAVRAVPKLSTANLDRDDAIYVIGYPQQNPRTVHDNSFVLFPFRASKRKFDELSMLVCAELMGSPDHDTELQQFIESYKPAAPPGEGFENYNVRWKSPVLMAECDTFGGDSGGGVFHRESGALVGLLMGGQDDRNEVEYSPGWRRHEAVLPIGEIVQQLNDKLPNWAVMYNVTVGQ